MSIENESANKQWRSLYVVGAWTTIIVLAGSLADIIIGSMLGGSITTIPQTAVDRFIQFQSNWLLGLYNLDLLNVSTTIIMIPTFIALFAAHRHSNCAFATLALCLFVVGTAIFITNNTALPMLELSHKYAASTSEAQRGFLAGAGEAMLARGAHGSLGAFFGFGMLIVAEIVMSFVMLTSRIFGKPTSILGILGTTLLFVYMICVTFLPGTKSVATMVAAPGGLMAMAWMIMFTIKLFKLSKAEII